MALLSVLIQIFGICVSVYLAFTHRIIYGLVLVAIVWFSHFAFSVLSKLLMQIHFKIISEDDRH